MSKRFIFALLIFFNGILALRVLEDSPACDRLGYNNCKIESNGEQLILRHFIPTTQTVFDVGACVGAWSKKITLYSNPTIYAFEPVPENFNELKKHAEKSTLCFNIALSNQTGKRPLYYYPREKELGNFYNREILRNSLGTPEKIVVNTETVDSFCTRNSIQRIDFLKIDTEGAELAILQSAERMLAHKQIGYIQFEYGGTFADAQTSLKEVYELLTKYDYKVYRIFQEGLIHIVNWQDRLENLQYSNYFASSIPIE